MSNNRGYAGTLDESTRVWQAMIRMLRPNCARWGAREANDLVRVGPVGLEPTTYGLKGRAGYALCGPAKTLLSAERMRQNP